MASSNLGLTLGALELGVLISSILYGVVTVQTYFYMESNFRDPIWLRSLVGIVWVLETAHTIFAWFLLYSLTVTNYGDTRTLDQITFSLVISFPLAAVIGAIVQGYFAHRVRVLSGRLVVPTLAWCGAILRCGLGFGIAVVPFIKHLDTLESFVAHYEWLLIVPTAINFSIDILNTSTSCFYLYHKRSSFKHSQQVVDKLVMYTVQTGLVTSLCALTMLACTLLHYSLLSMGLLTIYPKLFSNCFLTSLNARLALRQTFSQAHSTDASSVPPSDVESKGAIL